MWRGYPTTRYANYSITAAQAHVAGRKAEAVITEKLLPHNVSRTTLPTLPYQLGSVKHAYVVSDQPALARTTRAAVTQTSHAAVYGIGTVWYGTVTHRRTRTNKNIYIQHLLNHKTTPFKQPDTGCHDHIPQHIHPHHHRRRNDRIPRCFSGNINSRICTD